jgi:heme oxygenase (biliverdin-IX-beta and delta-forming)
MKNDAHARPRGEAEEPLYDVDVPTPSHAERAMTLASRARTATLGTIAREPTGYPYGSFVTFALHDGNPVFLISALAEHTRNLAADPRASLLIAENVQADPLANGRVTLLGRCSVVGEAERDAAREAFLGAHPNAGYYASFGDFSWWKLGVESVRYIGGYGRMSWVSREDWLAAEPDPLSEEASSIVDHMNADHAATMVDYCRALSRAVDATAATMTTVDRYGFEMSVTTAKGPRPVRLAFSHPVASAAEARDELIALARQARREGVGS